jgi:hypothetical protein
MDQDTSIYNNRLTSSFKSSGRTKSLMDDALHYQTYVDEVEAPNLGPCYYGQLDTWSSESRRNIIYVDNSVRPHNDHYEKPWKVRPKNKVVKKKNTRPTVGNNDDEIELSKERNMDILSVRKLPTYT